MADAFSSLIDTIMQYWWFFAAIGGIIAFFYFFTTWRSKTKIIKRGDVEKQELKERIKGNPSYVYKWLFHGQNIMGKITHFRMFSIVDDKNIVEIPVAKIIPDGKLKFEFMKEWGNFKPTDKMEIDRNDKVLPEVYAFLLAGGYVKEVLTKEADGKKYNGFVQMIIKPVFIPRIKITNPFASASVIQLAINDNLIFDRNAGFVTVPLDVAFDSFEGIKYDMTTMAHLNVINEQLLRTDFNSIASIYYVKSQEQSTYDPKYAHDMAIKEKDLQLELARRKGKMSTI